MVILLDLNLPADSVSDQMWDDTTLDTVMVIASPRPPAHGTHESALTASLDDDALVTWEDAEWQ